MLKLQGCNQVHNPIVPQDRINAHSSIVPPHFLVSQLLAQEGMLGMWVTETPVVVDVPEARVDAVDGCEQYEDCLGGRFLIHAVDAGGNIEQDGCDVLSAVQQMRELVSGVFVTSQTLHQSPYTRQRRHNAGNA